MGSLLYLKGDDGRGRHFPVVRLLELNQWVNNSRLKENEAKRHPGHNSPKLCREEGEIQAARLERVGKVR